MGVVVITGASAGVGRATAIQFARHGWRVDTGCSPGDPPQARPPAALVAEREPFSQGLDTTARLSPTLDALDLESGGIAAEKGGSS